jgi:hypothetical protein
MLALIFMRKCVLQKHLERERHTFNDDNKSTSLQIKNITSLIKVRLNRLKISFQTVVRACGFWDYHRAIARDLVKKSVPSARC